MDFDRAKLLLQQQYKRFIGLGDLKVKKGVVLGFNLDSVFKFFDLFIPLQEKYNLPEEQLIIVANQILELFPDLRCFPKYRKGRISKIYLDRTLNSTQRCLVESDILQEEISFLNLDRAPHIAGVFNFPNEGQGYIGGANYMKMLFLLFCSCAVIVDHEEFTPLNSIISSKLGEDYKIQNRLTQIGNNTNFSEIFERLTYSKDIGKKPTSLFVKKQLELIEEIMEKIEKCKQTLEAGAVDEETKDQILSATITSLFEQMNNTSRTFMKKRSSDIFRFSAGNRLMNMQVLNRKPKTS